MSVWLSRTKRAVESTTMIVLVESIRKPNSNCQLRVQLRSPGMDLCEGGPGWGWKGCPKDPAWLCVCVNGDLQQLQVQVIKWPSWLWFDVCPVRAFPCAWGPLVCLDWIVWIMCFSSSPWGEHFLSWSGSVDGWTVGNGCLSWFIKVVTRSFGIGRFTNRDNGN